MTLVLMMESRNWEDLYHGLQPCLRHWMLLLHLSDLQQVSAVSDKPTRCTTRILKSPWAIVWHCLCDPTFSHFTRTPTCDRQADRHTITACTTLAWHRMVKTVDIITVHDYSKSAKFKSHHKQSQKCTSKLRKTWLDKTQDKAKNCPLSKCNTGICHVGNHSTLSSQYTEAEFKCIL